MRFRLLVTLVSLFGLIGRASALPLTASLPAGTELIQEAQGDTDGDGQDETVSLYRWQEPRAFRGYGLSVERLGTTTDLFGVPDMPDPPPRPGSTWQLEVMDVTGDNAAEIIVRSESPPIGQRAPEHSVWIFGWEGAAYRLESSLQGAVAELTERNGKGSYGWRQVTNEDGDVIVEDRFSWRYGGYRLTSRDMQLSAAAPPSKPELAVLLHYNRIAQGDLRGAYDLFSDAMKTRAPLEQFMSGFDRTRSVVVEEAGPPDYAGDGNRARVPVRVVARDETGSGATAQAYVGTWSAVQQGDRWLLDSADIKPGVSLFELADALPGGIKIDRTVQGDLRGTGQDDVIVLSRQADRFRQDAYYLRSDSDAFTATSLADLADGAALGDFPFDVRIADVNGDGQAELVYGAGAGAHGSALSIFQWRNGELVTLFSDGTNTPGLALEDLNADGREEIIEPVSGYCGSYASSPRAIFVLRWNGGSYAQATADFPESQDGLIVFGEGAVSSPDLESVARACIQHMLAYAYVVQGYAPEARSAFHAYSEALRGPSTGLDDPAPDYLTEMFTDEMRELLERAEAGAASAIAGQDRALLFDLIGSARESNARTERSRMEYSRRDGRTDEAEQARLLGETATQDAAAAFSRALSIDPDDQDAQEALSRLGR